MRTAENVTAAIKAKIAPKLNKLKIITGRSFITDKFWSGIKEYSARFLDVRPRSEKDYYDFLGWYVSKRLAMAAVIVVSVLCIGFLGGSKPAKIQEENVFRSYKYNSPLLKFVTGKVGILGKSGYTAYIGDVENGTVKGKGTLYGMNGNVVYEGDFDANAYNGVGNYYYENGQLAYEGAFRDNRYCGEGKLYRENGIVWYEGNFNKGHMEGEGKLYSVTGKEIYNGSFQNDQIIYQELIGKSAAEIAAIYTGAREIYMGDGIYCVYMKDIDAIYFGEDRSSTLEEDFEVTGLYILRQDICVDGEQRNAVTQLREGLGDLVYEGNTLLEADDEIALNTMCTLAGRDVLYGKAGYQTGSVYDDVKEVSGFDRNYQAYIYVYEKEGIVYTFFCKDKDKGFDFYRME